ncbi:MAG: hypothetical protein K2P23_06295, partial [Lachnospiraceae bacterium]|nr:hypothetical protein [Lachnospiraceae bacterium]
EYKILYTVGRIILGWVVPVIGGKLQKILYRQPEKIIIIFRQVSPQNRQANLLTFSQFPV